MINKLVKNSWFPLAMRATSLFVFTFMMSVLYFGTSYTFIDIESDLVMLVIWTLWWPFLYITVILLARFWCGFLCPITIVSDFGNGIGKPKKNLLRRYKFLPYVLFFVIVLWEQISGLFTSVEITVTFFLSFLILSFLLGVFSKRYSFCQSVCPIGTLLGPFSRLSFIGLRTDWAKCKTCRTKECIMGGKTNPCPMYNNVPRLKSNQNCILCTKCIENCPHDSAKIVFVEPGGELKIRSGFSIPESIFIVALLGFSMILSPQGKQLVRVLETTNAWTRVLDFGIGIGAVIGIYLILVFIHTKFFSTDSYKLNLRNGGYVYLPLAFALMFSQIVFDAMQPFIKIDENIIIISKYAIFLFGAAWSIKVSFDLFRNKLVWIVSILAFVIFWELMILPGPLNINPVKPVDSSKFVEDIGVYYTREDVALHGNEEDCWIILDEFVFDMTPSAHPAMFSCGNDGSENYHKRHGAGIGSRMMPFVIGELEE